MTGMVILNYNDCDSTIKLYETVKKYSAIDKIVIVDNCSTDNSYLIIKDKCLCDVILADKNGGYAYGNNLGIRWLIDNYSVDYVVVSNPDVYFEEEFITNIINKMNNNQKIGIMSGVMHDSDGRINLIPYGKFPTYLDAILECFLFIRRIMFHSVSRNIDFSNEIMYVDVVWGSLFIFNVNAYIDSDGFDEETFLYHEENIMGKRLKKQGYIEAILTTEKYLHLHEVSISKSTNRVQRHIIRMNSQLYFQHNYNGVAGIKFTLLKLLMKFSVLEIRISNFLYNIIKGI